MDTGAALDLFRNEHRFFLRPEAATNFAQWLRRGWREVCFSSNPITLTVYLETDEHEIPSGVSVKLRRFLPEFAEPILLPGQVFRYECKRTFTDVGRAKTAPDYCEVKRALKKARSTFGVPGLRPYVAVEYRRRHFVPEDGAPLRVTIDRDTSYWFWESEHAGLVALGNPEQIARIECKVAPAYGTGNKWEELHRVLEEYGALPVISKRQEGYAQAGHYLVSRYGSGIEKDLRGVEIEAKFLVQHAAPFSFFHRLKAWTRQDTGPFLLADNLPYTVATASINQYWAAQGAGGLVDGIKFLFKSGQFTTVYKKEMEVIDAAYGLVRRREEKLGRKDYSPETYWELVREWMSGAHQPHYLGSLLRKRRAIWLIRELTPRVYHFSLDRCTVTGIPGPLWQLEIEYVGRLKGSDPTAGSLESTVIGELRDCAKRLCEIANRDGAVLVPSTLTKFQWLVGLFDIMVN